MHINRIKRKKVRYRDINSRFWKLTLKNSAFSGSEFGFCHTWLIFKLKFDSLHSRVTWESSSFKHETSTCQELKIYHLLRKSCRAHLEIEFNCQKNHSPKLFCDSENKHFRVESKLDANCKHFDTRVETLHWFKLYIEARLTCERVGKTNKHFHDPIKHPRVVVCHWNFLFFSPSHVDVIGTTHQRKTIEFWLKNEIKNSHSNKPRTTQNEQQQAQTDNEVWISTKIEIFHTFSATLQSD